MSDERTSAAVQRYLNELAEDSPAEPIVRELLGRAVRRLHLLCATLLYRSYPRLTQPPLNLQADELLSAVAERLLKAMREARPRSVRQFFALANQHMRWELNELARRLDEVLAQGAGASLRQRRGAGRRPEALRRGTADPGSALGLGRAVMALGPAQPGGGSARSDGAGPVRAGPWRRVVAGAAAGRAARQEGRESQAVEAVLEQAVALQERGRWPEARAVLEGAPSLLDSSAPAELRSAAGQRRTTCPAGGLPVQEPHALFSLPVRRCVRGRSESGGRPRPRHRHNAARVAALAGCGRGEDADKLNEEERMRWRKQARQWLRADLALWEKMLDSGSAMAPDLAKKMLTLWQAEPDLAGLREPSALDKLSADERRECLALWDEVANVLKANGGGR